LLHSFEIDETIVIASLDGDDFDRTAKRQANGR
jgi:hypothetical protein